MKISCIHVVIISLHTSLLLLYGSVQSSNCGDRNMRCDISDDSVPSSNRLICIPNSGMASNDQQLENITLEGGNMLTFTCRWRENFTTSNTFRGNLIAPEGWKVFLRVNSSRNIKVTAEDWHKEDQPSAGSTPDNAGSSEEDSRLFDSLGDRYFDDFAQDFLSKTNVITIGVLQNIDRNPSKFNETFNIYIRSVQVTDSVDSQDCTIMRMQKWDENGYNELDSHPSNPKGSLSIECSKVLPQPEHLISFYYDIKVRLNTGGLEDNASGLIQLVSEYVNSRDLITGLELDRPNLVITSDFPPKNSFMIRFNARGHMDLNIYNVIVQGLIYIDRSDESEVIIQTSRKFITPSQSSTQLSTTISGNSSSSTQLSSSASDNTNLSVPSSSTIEGQTSSDIPSMKTVGSNLEMKPEGAGGQGSQGFLIPTVSVLAIVALVSIAVISVCCRKRYHKNQLRESDSTTPNEDPRPINQERHDYCEVHPSGKPADLNGDGTIVSSSTPIENKRVVSGSMDATTYEEAVDYEDKTAEIKKPAASNGTVSMNGQEYAVVDMNKKALERREKAENALSIENYPKSNNDESYATLSLEQDRTSEGRDGQTKQSDSTSSPIKRVLRNGSEYAMVDMDKKTRGRTSARAHMGISNGDDQESNIDKGDKPVERGKASADDDKKTQLNQSIADYDDYDELQSPPIKDTPRPHSTKKNLHHSTSEDYDELKARANGLNSKEAERSTDFDDYDELQSTDTSLINKSVEGTTDYDDYDELESPINPRPSLNFSKMSAHDTQGEGFDESIHDYQAVSEPTSPTESIQPDPYLQNEYDTVSPPVSPGAVSVGHGTNDNENETTSSHKAVSLRPKQCPLNIHDSLKSEEPTENRDSTMSHTYEDPVAMALALERPYDKLQRTSQGRKQPSIPDGDAEGTDPEDDLNLYNEIASSPSAVKESIDSNDAYHHLQRPHTKRSVKADTPLPEIPGGEGYGKLDLDSTRQMHAGKVLDQDQRGLTTNEADPAYATLENPAEAKLPDDEDPDYDLLDAFV